MPLIPADNNGDGLRGQLRHLTGNTLIYGAGQALRQFLAFLLLPVFTAYLTPTDYGIVAILGIVGFVANSVFSLGLGVSMGICFFESESPKHRAETIWTSFLILLISAAILIIVTFFSSPAISLAVLENSGQQDLVVLFLLGTAVNMLTLPFVSYLQFEKQAGKYALLTTLMTVVTVGVSVILVAGMRQGVRGLLISILAGNILTLVTMMAAVLLQLKIRIGTNAGLKLLRLGLPLISSFFFLFVLQQSDRFFLQRLGGLHDLGIYSIGLSLGMAQGLVVSAFSTAWYPYFMSFANRRPEAEQLFGRLMTYYVFSVGTLTILFFLAAKPVLMMMTQPAFHPAYQAVGLTAAGQFFSGIFALLLPGMYFAREVKFLNLIQATASLVSILLYMLLIPTYGIIGTALASMLGYLCMAGLQSAWNLFRRKKYLRIEYEWRRIGLFSLILIAYAVALLWGREWSFWQESTFSLSAFCVLPFVISGLLNKAEKNALCSILIEKIRFLKRRLSLLYNYY